MESLDVLGKRAKAASRQMAKFKITKKNEVLEMVADELIKKAAAILINTQLEKSEMVRSDGNEFLIYLIGYSKTQINSYVQKLSRELEKLPYGFGAAFGYSMIDDEIKTIDDAINEATINMRKDKEQNYK